MNAQYDGDAEMVKGLFSFALFSVYWQVAKRNQTAED